MLKKILFMGSPIFAVPILKSLYQNGYPVSVVYTQPPKQSNRGMKTQKSPVHNMAETLNIDVRTPENLKGNLAEYNFLEELGVDLAIVVAYGKILPENFLPLAKMGFINIIMEEFKVDPTSLEGLTVVITGKLTQIDRKQGEELVRMAGGSPTGSISGKTNLLVAGEKAGSKLEKAKNIGVKIVDEQTFLKMIKADIKSS